MTRAICLTLLGFAGCSGVPPTLLSDMPGLEIIFSASPLKVEVERLAASVLVLAGACSAQPTPVARPPVTQRPAASLPSIRSYAWQDLIYSVDGRPVAVHGGEAKLRDDMGTFTPVDGAEIAERGMPEIQSTNRYVSLKVAPPQYADMDGDGRDDAVIARQVLHFEGPNVTLESSIEIYSSAPRGPQLITTIPHGTPWAGMIESVTVAPGRVDVVWFETGDGPAGPEHRVAWTWRARG